MCLSPHYLSEKQNGKYPKTIGKMQFLSFRSPNAPRGVDLASLLTGINVVCFGFEIVKLCIFLGIGYNCYIFGFSKNAVF